MVLECLRAGEMKAKPACRSRNAPARACGFQDGKCLQQQQQNVMLISLILYETNLSAMESVGIPTSLFQARARVIRALASPDYKSPGPPSPRRTTEGKFCIKHSLFPNCQSPCS